MTSSATNAPQGFAGLMAFVTVLPTEESTSVVQTDRPSASTIESNGPVSPEQPLFFTDDRGFVQFRFSPRAETSPSRISSSGYFWAVVSALGFIAIIVIFILAGVSANGPGTNPPHVQALKDYSQEMLCKEAYDVTSGNWVMFGPGETAAFEARARGLSLDECKVALGIKVMPTPETLPPTASVAPLQPSIVLPDLTETMPPIGSDLVLSRSNVRYCQYEKQRIESVRPLVDNDTNAAFNRKVDDFNLRCSSYRYQESDLNVVQSELPAKQMQFESDARALVRSWWTTPSEPNTEPSRIPSPTFPYTTRPPTEVVATPAISTEPPRAPIPSPSSNAASLPPPMDINPRTIASNSGNEDALTQADLLNEGDVGRIQHRLMELGFFKGPANGTWGPMSRLAFRNFKFANGLGQDDRLNDSGYARLMAPDATVASSSTPTGAKR